MFCQRLVSLLFLTNLSHTKLTLPVITEHPSSVTVSSGSPASLHCRTSPVSSVTWTRDSIPVSSSSPGLLVLPDGSLFLLSSRPSDSGLYRCLVGARGSQVHSRPATLAVRYLSTSFPPPPYRTVTATEGGMTVLPCNAPRGYPTPRVRWQREGEDVVEGPRRRVEGGRLLMEGLTLGDAGTYTCLASNSEGEVRDEPMELRVEAFVSSTHSVVLVERGEEELSLRVWVVAIALALVVTVALLAIMLVVCLRYTSLSYLPSGGTGDGGSSEHGSSEHGTYDSGHKLLYGGNCRDTPVHRPPVKREEQHYASCPVVRSEYSRPFIYYTGGQPQYDSGLVRGAHAGLYSDLNRGRHAHQERDGQYRAPFLNYTRDQTKKDSETKNPPTFLSV